MLVRRLVLVFSIVCCAFLALAVGVFGAGGGLGPGSYTFKSTSANASFGGKGDKVPQPTFAVFVNQGLNSFQAEDGEGAETVTRSTMVVFTMFNPDGTGGTSCFVIADSDFAVSENLQRATLHTILRTDNQCPGAGKPIGSATQAGVLPKGGTLLLPIRVDLTWTGAHVVSVMKDRFSFTCLDRQEDGSNTFRDSLGGSSSGTIAGVTVTTLSADVASQDGQLDIQGNLTPPCFR